MSRKSVPTAERTKVLCKLKMSKIKINDITMASTYIEDKTRK